MFKETTAKINEWYEGVLRNLDPRNFDPHAAADWFGQLLHPVQDLYAHSNWVETMSALGKTDLFDSGLGRGWLVTASWGQHPLGVIIAQGRTLPTGWKASLDEKARLVTVTDATGKKWHGIISGKWTGGHDCPCDPPMHHDDLNKDKPGRAFYAQARDFAVRQTKHEWCRLESLVFLRYGLEGLNKLRAEFIDPQKKSPCGDQVVVRAWCEDSKEWIEVPISVTAAQSGTHTTPAFLPVTMGPAFTLSAPTNVTVGGQAHVFVRWERDGVPVPAGQQGLQLLIPWLALVIPNAYSFTATGWTEVRAVYKHVVVETATPPVQTFVVRRTVTVNVSAWCSVCRVAINVPITISGGPTMHTPFALTVTQGTTVTLTAPATYTVGTQPLVFVRWEQEGGGVSDATTYTVTVASPMNLRAVYRHATEFRLPGPWPPPGGW